MLKRNFQKHLKHSKNEAYESFVRNETLQKIKLQLADKLHETGGVMDNRQQFFGFVSNKAEKLNETQAKERFINKIYNNLRNNALSDVKISSPSQTKEAYLQNILADTGQTIKEKMQYLKNTVSSNNTQAETILNSTVYNNRKSFFEKFRNIIHHTDSDILKYENEIKGMNPETFKGHLKDLKSSIENIMAEFGYKVEEFSENALKTSPDNWRKATSADKVLPLITGIDNSGQRSVIKYGSYFQN